MCVRVCVCVCVCMFACVRVWVRAGACLRGCIGRSFSFGGKTELLGGAKTIEKDVNKMEYRDAGTVVHVRITVVVGAVHVRLVK